MINDLLMEVMTHILCVFIYLPIFLSIISFVDAGVIGVFCFAYFLWALDVTFVHTCHCLSNGHSQ